MLSFLSFFLIEFQKNKITRLGYNYSFNYFKKRNAKHCKAFKKKYDSKTWASDSFINGGSIALIMQST